MLNVAEARVAMRRRDVLALLGGTAMAWPLTARSQQPVPMIGFLSSLTADDATSIMAAFHAGLNEAGYFEGNNVSVQYRWGGGQYGQLPTLAADLVRDQVAVIAAISGTLTALAAKAATKNIPIVFAIGGDPVAPGLVSNLSRPDANVTGVTFYTAQLMAKRLELLHELVPPGITVAVLVNAVNPPSALEGTNAEDAAKTLGFRVRLFNAASAGMIDDAFAAIVQDRIGALAVSADPVFFINREKLVSLAARHGVPTIFADHEQAEAGGLISYGANRPDAYRQAGVYVARILKGAKPADLPVVQPTKFELVINLKTANALGLTVPQSLLARADEVIE